MRRVVFLAAALALAAPCRGGSIGRDGLNEARDLLMQEFKGAQVRCRVDILGATPYWSWDVMTTGTPHGVTYPNHTQPVAFESLSLVQMREFDVRNGGVRVVVTIPAFDLKRLGRVGWDFLELGGGRSERRAEARATRMENVQCVFLQSDRVEDIRAALASLFYLDGEQPPQEEIEACLSRNWYRPPLVARSLCGFHDPPHPAWHAANNVSPTEAIGGEARPNYGMSSTSRNDVPGSAERPPRAAAPLQAPRGEPPRPLGNPDERGVVCPDNTFHVSAFCQRRCSVGTHGMTRRDAIRRGVRECSECRPR